MEHRYPAPTSRRLSLRKIAKIVLVATGAFVLVCILALLIFPGHVANVLIKPRITKAFAEAYPAYTLRIGDMAYGIFTNRFTLHAVALSAGDGTFSGHAGSFSVSGIGWMHLLWGGTLEQTDFDDAVADAQQLVLHFPETRYDLRCGRFELSVPDSEIVVESLEVLPRSGDADFFAGSAFRRTRLSLVISECRAAGVACLDLLRGKWYRARSIHIDNPTLDVLVNKDKPDSRDTSIALLPNEILSSIGRTLRINRLGVMNGQLKYGEQFAVGSKPAWLTFDSVQVLAEGIANHGHPGAELLINAHATFMKAGTMSVTMAIPVESPDASFRYSGSLSGMDLRPLNSFLEVSDHMRITAGVLQGATFAVTVVSGHASGYVQGAYTDLTLAALDKETGSAGGVSNGIASFIANTLVIRRNNIPGKPGSMKIGTVKYLRVRDDPFFQFEWFALRTGVRDVLGF